MISLSLQTSGRATLDQVLVTVKAGTCEHCHNLKRPSMHRRSTEMEVRTRVSHRMAVVGEG